MNIEKNAHFARGIEKPRTFIPATKIQFREKMRITPILLGAGALVALNLISKGSAAKSLNFYPGSVKSLEFDGVTPVITLGLLVQNTSNQQILFRSFAGNIYANDFLVGNVATYQPTVVPANSQITYNLTVRLSPLGVVNELISIIQGANPRSMVMELQASANIDVVRVPVKIKYSIG